MNAAADHDLPELLVLPQNRSVRLLKWSGILAGVALLGTLGALMFLASQPGWAILLLVVLAAWVIAFWIHLTETLRLDRQGFEYRIGPRTWRCAWAECQTFEVRAGARDRVVIRFMKPRPVFNLMGSGISRDEALLTSFELKASRLVDLMNRFRERALSDGATSAQN